MQELLRLMQSGHIGGVVTKEFSRLMRPDNFTDFVLLQHFKDTGVVLYLPDGPIDFSSKTGRLLGTVRAAIAGLERGEILERMRDGKEAMRRAGKHPSGATTLPFGVGYTKERGWCYTEDAEKVKAAFGKILTGTINLTELAEQLNIPRTNLRYVLQNNIYTGIKVYDHRRDPSPQGYVARPDGRQGERRKIKRPPEEVIRVQVLPPLVDADEFARVQSLLECRSRRDGGVRKENRARYTYNGFLRCADCGALLYTHTANDAYYICKSHHPREKRKRSERGLQPCVNKYILRKKIEPKLDSLLGKELHNPEFLGRIVTLYRNAQAAAPRTGEISVKTIEHRLASLEDQRVRVVDTYVEGVISREERDVRLQQLQREVDSSEMLRSSARQQPTEISPGALACTLEPFLSWEFLSRNDKRALLANLFPEIMLHGYQVRALRMVLPPQSGCYDGSRSKMAPFASRAPPCR
jgi:DNA invertase Pin-like site-specific DNA recombinase